VNASETDGGVFKLSPSGQLTRFITDKRATGAIAMARDGSVWLGADWPTMALLHYDAQGKLIAAHDLSSISAGGGPHHVALGPSGDPYFSNYQNLYRFRAGSAERLIHYESTDSHQTEIGSFAFDVQGNIYIPNQPAGVVNLHDGTGKWLATIAYQPNAPSRVFFGRNADGSTNARLFAIDGNQLIELDPAGARAGGLPVQFEPQQVQEEATVADAVTDLLKGGVLTAAQRTDLDQRGNKNGRYDVGDLRALLIRSGILTTPTGAH
jgi:streptogramin lyase